MHERIQPTGATPATAADLESSRHGPSIRSMVRVPPSREAARGLRDRLRAVTGGDPTNLVGNRGLAVVREVGRDGAIAIGWSLRRAGPSRDVPTDAVPLPSDLADPSFDPATTPCAAFDWDARRLALSILGQTLLDGVMTGREWPALAMGHAHEWGRHLEQLLKVGPASAADAQALVHVQTLCELADVDPRDLSTLLRAAFALVDPDVVATAIVEATAQPVDLLAGLEAGADADGPIKRPRAPAVRAQSHAPLDLRDLFA